MLLECVTFTIEVALVFQHAFELFYVRKTVRFFQLLSRKLGIYRLYFWLKTPLMQIRQLINLSEQLGHLSCNLILVGPCQQSLQICIDRLLVKRQSARQTTVG